MPRMTPREAYLSCLKYHFFGLVVEAGYPTQLALIRPLYQEAKARAMQWAGRHHAVYH